MDPNTLYIVNVICTLYINVHAIYPCPFDVFLQGLPSFGPFMKERKAVMASHKENADLLHTQLEPEKVRPAFKPDKPVPLVKVSLVWYE